MTKLCFFYVKKEQIRSNVIVSDTENCIQPLLETPRKKQAQFEIASTEKTKSTPRELGIITAQPVDYSTFICFFTKEICI